MTSDRACHWSQKCSLVIFNMLACIIGYVVGLEAVFVASVWVMGSLCVVDDYHNGIPCEFNLYEKGSCFISDHLRMNRVWEKYLHNVFDRYVGSDSVVIEGGCHVGSHTLKLAYLSRHVHAFEPLPSSFSLLSKNKEINQMDNITLHKKALSDVQGVARYGWSTPSNPGASGLADNPMGLPSWSGECSEEVEVEVTTIDALKLDKLDFIKLDIEGYEPLAIQGGMATIASFMPIITMEIWSDHFGNLDINHPKTIFKNLLDLGYVYGQIGSSPDFLFVPSSRL